jgi:ATP-dependent DNA helicase RecQ
MQKDSKCVHFLLCLHFSIIHSLYSDVILKPKQVICLEKIFLGEDILAILPTGYGKSLIYQLLPLILFRKKMLEEDPTRGIISINDVTTVLLVISPLNSLISDQIRKLLTTGLRVSSLNVSQQATTDGFDVDKHSKKEELASGYYNLLFAHPEAFISCKFGQELANSPSYQKNVCAIVIDEAHCILEW